MTPFRTITGIAAPLADADVNTDIIFPARFLLLPDKVGLGSQLFHEKRHGAAGKAPFILDTVPFDHAVVLVAGPNFGCGSSREQAVWALADFGIRCVIAPSFGEIFYANCFKNGMLPIETSLADHQILLVAAAEKVPFTVDLEAQTLFVAGRQLAFKVAPERRDALLRGLDEIGAILEDDLVAIEEFEEKQQRMRPWLTLDQEQLAFFADLADEEALKGAPRTQHEMEPGT